MSAARFALYRFASRLAALAFLATLVMAHWPPGDPLVLQTPMSMFRDGDSPAIGFALFGLLIFLGVIQCAMAVAAEQEVDAGVFRFALILLGLVAITPSLNVFHGLCSFVLMGMMFGYYILLLNTLPNNIPLIAHAGLPGILAWFAGSYGLWQKPFIVYIVFANLLRQELCYRRPEPRRKKARAKRSQRANSTFRPGVIFVPQPNQTWGRQKTPCRRRSFVEPT